MEPWLIITLIVAGVVVLGLAVYAVLFLTSLAMFRKSSREFDKKWDEQTRRIHGGRW